MAQRLPLKESMPFAVQLKELNDSELLDFWEETQQVEHVCCMLEPEAGFIPDYERLILLELQLRSCQRRRPAR